VFSVEAKGGLKGSVGNSVHRLELDGRVEDPAVVLSFGKSDSRDKAQFNKHLII